MHAVGMYKNFVILMGLCFYAGPKAWPGGMSLISFFALNVFFQALVAEITTSI